MKPQTKKAIDDAAKAVIWTSLAIGGVFIYLFLDDV